MVVIKMLCFRWMSPFFMRVHDNNPTPNMQSAVSDIGKRILTELQCSACKQYMVPHHLVSGWPQHLRHLQTECDKLPNLQTAFLDKQKCLSGEPVAADEVSVQVQ